MAAKKPKAVYVSVSQAKTFCACKRKWAFNKLDGIKEPTKVDAQFGIDGHDRAEQHLKTGAPLGDDDIGETCKQGAHKWPERGDHLGLEHKFQFKVLDGRAILVGYIDILVKPGGGHELEVIDHKFTKDLRYAMSEEALREDFQSGVYLHYAMTNFLKTEGVARWLYYCARPKKDSATGRPRTPRGFREVKGTFTLEQVTVVWEEFLKVCEEIVTIKNSGVEAKDVEPNPSACWDYGGCYYSANGKKSINICKISATDALYAIENKTKKISHLSKDQKAKAKGKNEMSLLDRLKAKKNGTNGAAESTTRGEIMKDLATRQAEDGATGVNPPAVEPNAEATAAREAAQNAEAEKVAAKKAPATGKRKRRTKAEMAADKAAEAGETTTEAPPAETAPAPQVREAQAPGNVPSKNAPQEASQEAQDFGLDFVILIDCFYAKKSASTETLAEFIAPAAKAICDKKGVYHWNALDYAEGKTMLEAFVEKMITEDKPIHTLLCDSRSIEWAACGGILQKHADVVIRGV